MSVLMITILQLCVVLLFNSPVGNTGGACSTISVPALQVLWIKATY